jgi:hypothetical protein
MSKKINIILLSLLVLQAVLIAVLYAPDSKNVQSEITFLPGVTPQDTVSVLISSAEGGEIRLIKNDQDAWLVSDKNTIYPGDKKHIEDVISRITSLKSNRLVTQTQSSHLRLKVAAKIYERKIVLTDKNDQEHTLYLGISTAPQTIHVRRSDSQDVYFAKGMSSWELNTDTDLWWDRNYLDADLESLHSIELINSHGSFTLMQAENQWRLANEKEITLSPGKVREFLQGASHISLTKYLGKEDLGYGFEKPAATLILTGDQGSLSLKVAAKRDEEGRFVAKSSESSYYVEVTDFAVEKLINTRKVELIAKDE